MVFDPITKGRSCRKIINIGTKCSTHNLCGETPVAYVGKKQNPREPALLINRHQAGEILNRCPATIARLEKAGVIKRVRLKPNSPTAEALYRRSDIIALTEGEADADAESEDA